VRSSLRAIPLFACAGAILGAPAPPDEFVQSIRPVLQEHCSACHSAANSKNRVDFLKAMSTQDVESSRALWRNVAAQLRNRTMPPVASKLTEDDRLRLASWISDRLRQTACAAGDYAGAVTVRRLNRRAYRNTVRDLLGVDLSVNELFPADGSGGEGFDTNGETLFLPRNADGALSGSGAACAGSSHYHAAAAEKLQRG